MSEEKTEVSTVEFGALALVTISVITVYGKMIARTATTEAERVAMIEQFRNEALWQVKGSESARVAMDQEADIMTRACEHIEGVCKDWLGNGAG